MIIPMPPLAPRLPLGRRSTLLLDYRAEDLSLLCRSGQLLSLYRAGVGTSVTDGGLATDGYGAPRFHRVDTDGDYAVDTMSLLIEPAVSQLCTYTRDLSNAAWTKSNLSAALSQTGFDGALTSASLLTATAGNGTALQAITSGSAQRVTSVWARRSVGSGTVQMTQDNGSTWLAMTLTADWRRFSIAPVTSANPTVGFRIVTNGDAIVVDFVQHELGAYPTSPVARTSGAAARIADAVNLVSAWPFSNNLTVYAKIAPDWAAVSRGIGTTAYGVTLGNAVTRLSVSRAGASGGWTGLIDTSGTDASTTQAAPVTPMQEVCVQFANLAGGGTVAVDVGTGLSAPSSAASAASVLGSADVFIGGFSSAGNELGGGLIGLKIAAGLFTMTQMRGAR